MCVSAECDPQGAGVFLQDKAEAFSCLYLSAGFAMFSFAHSIFQLGGHPALEADRGPRFSGCHRHFPSTWEERAYFIGHFHLMVYH